MTLSRPLKQIALAAALTFSVNAATPRPAEAVVGIVHGNGALIFSGSILAVLAMGLFVRSATVSDPFVSQGTLILGVAATVGAIILLDGPSGPRLGYTELSTEQREQLGISDTDYEIYEAQLEEIAALTDSGAASAVAAGVRNEQEAKAHFEREYANLEPETLSVMAKIIQANLVANSGTL